MTRIVKVVNTQSKLTPRGITKSSKSGSWHDASQLTRSQIKTRISVRRLHVNDPNNPIWYPVQDQFSTNLNPRFNPSKAPGTVTKLDSTPVPPKGASAGHQKTIKQTNMMKTGGKTLRRVTFP